MTIRLLRYVATLALLLTGVAPIQAQEGQAAGDDAVTEILAAWQARYERLPAVRVQLTGEDLRPSFYKLHEFKQGPLDLTFPFSGDFLVQFDPAMYRAEVFRHTSQVDGPSDEIRGYDPRWEIATSDGTTSVLWLPPDRNAELYRTRPNQEEYALNRGGGALNSVDLGGLDAICVACGVVSRGTDRLKPETNAEFWRAVGHEAIDGADCVVLQNGWEGDKQISRVWVDPTRDAVIIKYEQNFPGRYRNSIQFTYRRYESEWMPQSWIAAQYDFRRKAELSRQLRTVKAWDLAPDIALENFQQDVRPGAVFKDFRLYDRNNQGAELRMVKGAPGEPDMNYAEFVLKTSSPPGISGLKLMVLCTGGLIALVLIVFAVWRMRERHSA